MSFGYLNPSRLGLQAQGLADGGVESPLTGVWVPLDLLADESVALGSQLADLLLQTLTIGRHLLHMGDALFLGHLLHLGAQLGVRDLGDVEILVHLAAVDEVPILALVVGGVLEAHASSEGGRALAGGVLGLRVLIAGLPAVLAVGDISR